MVQFDPMHTTPIHPNRCAFGNINVVSPILVVHLI